MDDREHSHIAIVEEVPKGACRRLIVVHRNGDDPEGGPLLNGPPWCGGVPVGPAELAECDVLLINWVGEQDSACAD